jgi:peptidoglycan/LPS O-acetylase OafA/YrhL
MTAQAGAAGHLSHLDGLRGLAALQVIALHNVMAFLPGLSLGFTPLQALYDGTFAVSLFFLLSGAVLTLSFARTVEDIAGTLARRLVRLWLPIAASGVVACLLTVAIPDAHTLAGQLTGSLGWLGVAKPTPSVSVLLREVFVDSMPLGTAESSLFAGLLPGLRPLGRLLDPPVWSLHVELYGSLLVLGLTWLRAHSARWHRIAAPCLFVLLLPHPIALLVLGHLTAPWLRPTPWQPGAPRMRAAAIPMIAAGLLLIATPPEAWLTLVNDRLAQATIIGLPQMYGAFTVQRMLAAVLVYTGVLAGVEVQRALAGPVPRWLGRLSFSLYLIHFPILFTLTSWGFVVLLRWLPFGIAMVAAIIGGLGVTVVAAMLFERWVDRPAIALSRWVADPRRVPSVVAATTS